MDDAQAKKIRASIDRLFDMDFREPPTFHYAPGTIMDPGYLKKRGLWPPGYYRFVSVTPDHTHDYEPKSRTKKKARR